jgi:hypothetical protein
VNPRIALFRLTLAAVLALPVLAHCDGLDGPVVQAARKALAARNVNLVLVWVQPSGEAEIRQAFTKTLAVRGLNPEAQQLADTYFFETLVRVHRAGEGAPYTGLKPAGRDLGSAIPAADQAVEAASAEALVRTITETATHGLHTRFQKLQTAKNYKPSDLAAGRDFVKAYVDFLHYVEALDTAARAGGHAHEAAAAEHHEH